jgi:transposase
MSYTFEQKKEAVRLVKEEHLSYLKAGRVIGGVSKTTVLQWVKSYEQHGYDVLKDKSGRKKYTGEFKIQAVEYMRANGLSIYSASAHFGIAKTQLQRWERIYCLEGKTALLEERRGRNRNIKLKEHNEDTSISKEALFEENQRLKMENEYLKKLYALVQKKPLQ